MKNLLISAITAAIFVLDPTAAFAGPDEDAAYIAEQTITKSLFVGAIVAQRPLILSSLENEFRKKGIKISDMERETVKFYTMSFTPEQLADLADFYSTSTGQLLIQKTPELMLWSAKTGAVVGAAAGKNANARVAKRLKDEDISVTDDKSMMDRLLQMLK